MTNTAICYYYNGKLLKSPIILTSDTTEERVRKMPERLMVSSHILESKLGIVHSRTFKLPYKARDIQHLTRSADTEPLFASIELLQDVEGLTDIFKVQCEKIDIPEDQIIYEGRSEYHIGFFVALDNNGGYNDLQTIIDFYREYGWTKEEIIETILRFLNHEYWNEPWHIGYHFNKLRQVAAKNLELLGLEQLPEIISEKFVGLDYS